MCACKKPLSDCPPGQNIGHRVSEDKKDNKQTQTHTMPPFLCLDSTGEVASDKRLYKHNCSKWCKKLTNKLNQEKLDTAHSEPHYLKNLVHNCLNMSTVIDTANGYIESASSYLGFNNTKGGKSSLVGNQKSMNYWNSIMGIGNKDRDTATVADTILMESNIFAKEKAMIGPDITRDQATMWPKGFLGAYDILGKKVTCPNANPGNNFAYTQRTPQGCHPSYNQHRSQHELANNNKNSNQNSKPYNARLLENSKKEQATCICEERKDTDRQKYVPPFARNGYNACENVKQEMCTKSTVPSKDSENNGECHHSNGKCVTENNENFKHCVKTEEKLESCHQKANVERDKHTNDVQDWFEYESENVTTIPVEFHATVTSANQTRISDNSKSEKATCRTMPSISGPLLQSWHSTEYDADVKKKDSTCDISGQIFTVSDNDKAATETESIGPGFPKVHVKMEKVNVQSGGKSDNCNVKPSVPSENKEQLPVILFVRKIQGSKKSRPSAKKRRRQKAKQEAANTCDETPPTSATAGSAKSPHNPIAFLLGIDSDTCTSDGKCQSFLMSCDINSDSDLSDSDLECDGGTDDSPIDDDFQDEFSLFTPLADQFNPLNFKVTCSIQPTCTPTATSSSIDAINLSWNVNISVKKEETSSPTKSEKRVRFAGDKELATVHRMVTWAHAYQSSRKGQWEVFARDRDRFRRRVQELEQTLSPILAQQHRDGVFQDRFCMNLQ